jgi:hypothetical protein
MTYIQVEIFLVSFALFWSIFALGIVVNMWLGNEL